MPQPSPLPPCSKCLVSEGWLHLAHLAEDDPVALASFLTREGTPPLDRACAVRELARVGAPIAGPAVLAMLDDESAMVREDAAEALGQLRYPGAREGLRAMAESDPAGAVRAAAYEALRRLGGEGGGEEP